MVKGIDREGVAIAEGPTEIRLDARTMAWTGGVATPPLGRALAKSAAAETDKSGRIKVGPRSGPATLPKHIRDWDLAICLDCSAKPLPGVAQVAMQGGVYAAKSIVKRMKTGEGSRLSSTAIREALQ